MSNESAQKVFFDNLVIHHNKGHLLEEDQYYPFGLKMAGISDEALPVVPNNYLYNGKELNNQEFSDQTGLDWYDYGFRNYDPQLGRFIEQDPLTDEFATVSPYQYGLNDPVANVDEDGLAGLPVVTITAQAVNRMSAFSSFTSAIIGVAPLVGNVTSLTVHAMQIGGTVINGLSVTKGVGNASWPPWKRIHSILQGLWYNFEGNMTQAISSEAEVGVGLARDVQQKVYDYKHFNQGSTKDKIGLILGTIQLITIVVAPEEDPEGVISKAEDLSKGIGSTSEELEEGGNITESGSQYTRSNLKLGREVHKEYHAGEFGKEFRLPSGRRIDFLDIKNGVIHELKPNNPRAIRQGYKQLKDYLKELQSPETLQKYPDFKGIKWEMILDLY